MSQLYRCDGCQREMHEGDIGWHLHAPNFHAVQHYPDYHYCSLACVAKHTAEVNTLDERNRRERRQQEMTR